MSLDEVFRNLGSANSRERERAAAALRAEVERMAAHTLRTRNGAKVRIPENDRGDVVGAALVALVKRLLPGGKGVPVIEKGPAACQGYLAATLVNHYLSILRKRKAEDVPYDERVVAKVPAPEPGPEVPSVEDLRARARAILEPYAQRVIEDRPQRYREGYALTWKQLNELVFEGASIEHILARDEGIGPDASPREFKRARDRIYANHCRFRAHLEELFPPDGPHAGALRLLSRCQRPEDSASP
jgi:DNA-directed RNA polymerase specialized sigma24 family protein